MGIKSSLLVCFVLLAIATAQDPIAHLKFDGDFEGDLLTTAGTEDPIFVADRFGNANSAIYFGEESKPVRISNTTIQSVFKSAPMTLSFWMSRKYRRTQPIFDARDTPQNGGFEAYVGTNGDGITMCSANACSGRAWQDNLPAGTWFLLTFVVQSANTNIEFYVNNVLATDFVVTGGPVLSATSNFLPIIGGDAIRSGNGYAIDDMKFWDSALDSTERSAQLDFTYPPFAPFNQGLEPEAHITFDGIGEIGGMYTDAGTDPEFEADRFGNPNSALCFEDGAKELEITDEDVFAAIKKAPLTIAFWLSREKNQRQRILTFRDNPNSVGLELYSGINGTRLTMCVTSSCSGTAWIDNTPARTWNLIMLEIINTNNQITLSVNNEVAKVFEVTPPVLGNAQSRRPIIGETTTGLSGNGTCIDDFRVYSRMLEQWEKNALLDFPPTPPPTSAPTTISPTTAEPTAPIGPTPPTTIAPSVPPTTATPTAPIPPTTVAPTDPTTQAPVAPSSQTTSGFTCDKAAVSAIVALLFLLL